MTQFRTLFLEYLSDNPVGSFMSAANGVAKLGIDHRMLNQTKNVLGDEFSYALSHQDSSVLREAVRQEMWLLLGQGLLVFGKDENNPNWPWYRLTEAGMDIVSNQHPLPYDPDGFIREFLNKNPSADSVIVAYVQEAVRSFNHGCPIASSVMVGAASEKALLLLFQSFELAISDPAKKKKFAKTYRWTIHSKYRTLKEHMDLMISSRRLPSPMKEYAVSEVPGAFELIRRQRNEAGHPELYTGIDSDTVFLNLRVLTEYVRRIYDLIEHFANNGVDW
jgi:hypothetical protein